MKGQLTLNNAHPMAIRLELASLLFAHKLILHGQKVKVQVLAFSPSTTVPLGQCTVILLLNVNLNA